MLEHFMTNAYRRGPAVSMSGEEQAVVPEEQEDKQTCEIVMPKKQENVGLLESQRLNTEETRPQWR